MADSLNYCNTLGRLARDAMSLYHGNGVPCKAPTKVAPSCDCSPVGRVFCMGPSMNMET